MKKIIIPTTSELNVSEKYDYHSRKNSTFKNYLNTVFEKPWGHEYLTYQNDKIGIWILHILKHQKTSLHCHFKKDSLLIVLSGSFKIETYDSYYILNELESLYFPANAFHGIQSYSDNGIILEVEIYSNQITYSDKNDLLRFKDIYNRDKNTYEGSVVEKKIELKESINFHDKKEFRFQDTNINIQKKKRIDTIHMKDDFYKNKNDTIILLSGNILNGNVLHPGSIIDQEKDIIIIDDEIEYMILSNDYKLENKKIIYNKEHLIDLIHSFHFTNIGLTSGCFDIMHKGHIHNLKSCKKKCDTLFVCLSSDKQIKELKGKDRPVNNIKDRTIMLSTISFIDYIVLYDEIDNASEKELDNIMSIINPEFWFKGSDYTENEIRKKHPILKNICLFDNIANVSTTNIINNIQYSKKIDLSNNNIASVI